jgi:ABC-type multidrug transport system fused ATPase/permease subunit
MVERKQLTLSQIPRLWLETIGVIGLAMLIGAVVFRSGRPADVLPTVGLFAAAAFRVIPSANRLMTSLQFIRYSDAVVVLIGRELLGVDNASKVETLPVSFLREIILEGVSYSYPSSKSPTIKNINITIKRGECIGLIGPSGAGKSTLVDILLGLLIPNQGSINVDGINIKNRLRGWQDLIGYVPQSIFLTDDTLAGNIAFGLADDDISENAIWAAVRLAQLESFVESLPDGIQTYVGERGIRLSGGQRQRIGIARALYHNPQVLVFDEATSALDSKTEGGVMDAITALKKVRTIIIIAHRLSTIENCDVVYSMSNGSIEQVNSNVDKCES